MEIDLAEMFNYFKNKIIIILMITVLFGTVAGGYTYFLIPIEYSSVSKIYFNPRIIDGKYSAADMLANYNMINNYVAIIEGNNLQTKVANRLGVKLEEISEVLSVEAIENTEIIQVTAITTDSKFSKEIVDTVTELFIQEMNDSLKITNIAVVEDATESESPVSRGLKRNVILASGTGLILILIILFMKFMFDSSIHNKEDAELQFGIPNFGIIPDTKG